MGLIKFLRDGSWWVTSESDPRWNGSGQGLVGMQSMPREAQAFVTAKILELGEDPPDDLTYGYMKD